MSDDFRFNINLMDEVGDTLQDLLDVSNIKLLNDIKEKGVIVVNGLEKLKGVIQ